MGDLARMLPESEFRDWQRYAARRMLPTRRLEMQLAQIALQVARLAGVPNVSLEDFLFDPDDAAGQDDPTAEEAPASWGFQPRNLGGE